jgi:hypothetical protein
VAGERVRQDLTRRHGHLTPAYELDGLAPVRREVHRAAHADVVERAARDVEEHPFGRRRGEAVQPARRARLERTEAVGPHQARERICDHHQIGLSLLDGGDVRRDPPPRAHRDLDAVGEAAGPGLRSP